MIQKCPQCVDCVHYELLNCDIHNNLKHEAYEDKCKDFEGKLSKEGTFGEMFAEYMKGLQHPS